MSGLTFSVLDLNNAEEIIAYERALFRAFQGTEILTLDEIWDYDKSKRRLKTKIPYQSQEVYITKLQGMIIGGVPVNFNMKEPLQLEMMGFSIDKSAENICEGLGVFSLQVFHETIPVGLELRDYAFERIKQKNIKIVYGTCSQRKLKGYLNLKFKVIDERIFKGEKKYLLIREIK